MIPPGLLKFRVHHTDNPDVKFGVLRRQSPPDHSGASRVIGRRHNCDGLVVMGANAGTQRLHFFNGRVHVVAGFAEIHARGKLGAEGALQIGARDWRQRLSPERFLRNAEQDPIRAALFYKGHRPSRANFLSNDGSLQDDCGIDVFVRWMICNQQRASKQNEKQDYDDHSDQKPAQQAETGMLAQGSQILASAFQKHADARFGCACAAEIAPATQV